MKDLPESELLSAYLDGELTAAEQARVEQSLAASPKARQLLDELRALSGTLQSLPQAKVGEDLGQQVLRLAERQMLTGHADLPAPAERPRSLLRRLLNRRALAWSGIAAAVALIIYVNEQHQNRPGRPDGVAMAPPEAREADRGEVRDAVRAGEPMAIGPREETQEEKGEAGGLPAKDLPSTTAKEQRSREGAADMRGKSAHRAESAGDPQGPGTTPEAVAKETHDGAGVAAPGPAARPVPEGDRFAESRPSDGAFPGHANDVKKRFDGRTDMAKEGGFAAAEGAPRADRPEPPAHVALKGAVAGAGPSSGLSGVKQDGVEAVQHELARQSGADHAGVLVVQLDISPETARQRAFDRLLAENKIVWEQPPTAEDSVDAPDEAAGKVGQAGAAAKAVQPARKRDDRLQRGRQAGMAGLDLVYVEATAEQIEPVLAQLAARPGQFLNVSVEPAPDADAQRGWNQYNRRGNEAWRGHGKQEAEQGGGQVAEKNSRRELGRAFRLEVPHTELVKSLKLADSLPADFDVSRPPERTPDPASVAATLVPGARPEAPKPATAPAPPPAIEPPKLEADGKRLEPLGGKPEEPTMSELSEPGGHRMAPDKAKENESSRPHPGEASPGKGKPAEQGQRSDGYKYATPKVAPETNKPAGPAGIARDTGGKRPAEPNPPKLRFDDGKHGEKLKEAPKREPPADSPTRPSGIEEGEERESPRPTPKAPAPVVPGKPMPEPAPQPAAPPAKPASPAGAGPGDSRREPAEPSRPGGETADSKWLETSGPVRKLKTEEGKARPGIDELQKNPPRGQAGPPAGPQPGGPSPGVQAPPVQAQPGPPPTYRVLFVLRVVPPGSILTSGGVGAAEASSLGEKISGRAAKSAEALMDKPAAPAEARK